MYGVILFFEYEIFQLKNLSASSPPLGRVSKNKITPYMHRSWEMMKEICYYALLWHGLLSAWAIRARNIMIRDTTPGAWRSNFSLRR